MGNFFPSQYHNVILYFDRFLFEKEETGQKNKVILYTGDFRLEHIRLPTLKDLHTSAGEPIKIDIMYLDTTFCSKEYENFPIRDDAIQAIWDLVNSWIKKNGKTYFTYLSVPQCHSSCKKIETKYLKKIDFFYNFQYDLFYVLFC